MKKIIGILGIAVLAISMFFNTDTMNGSNEDLDLANVFNINTANAEDTMYWKKTHFNCTITVSGEAGAWVTIWGYKYKIPLSGSITVTSNVGVDCQINGTYQCTTFDCHNV